MEEQNLQPNIPEQPDIQPEISQKQGMPTWAIILITVLVIVVIGGGGYAAYQYYGQFCCSDPDQPLDQGGVLPTGGDINEIADWQTYRNEEYGFEVKYPRELQQKENDNDHGLISELFSGEDGHFWIFVENNEMGLDATGIKENYYKNDTYGYQYQDTFPMINNIISYKQGRYDWGVIERYSIPKDDKIYSIAFEFNFSTPNQELKDKKTDLINQILSTFKFIETNETANWQTYRNEEYGFEVKYPTDWSKPFVQSKNPFTGLVLVLPSLEKRYEAQYRIAIGLKEKGGCEGIDCYYNFIDGFNVSDSEEIAENLSSTIEGFITIKSDTYINNSRVIVYSSPGICGDAYAFIFGSRSTVRFTARCAYDDMTLLDIFNQILSTFKFID